MAEQKPNKTRKWNHNDKTSYSLNLSPAIKLDVGIDYDCVFIVYNDYGKQLHSEELYSEEILYRRQQGTLKTFVTKYKQTPQGRVGNEQINAEPARIIENADVFSSVPGIRGKDKKLVDIVMGFVKEQF